MTREQEFEMVNNEALGMELARQTLNPLDVLKLIEKYSEETRERINRWDDPNHAYVKAVAAFHWARVFCTIDNSYLKNW